MIIVRSKILIILKFKIIPAIIGHLLKNHVYTARFGPTKGLKRKGGLGFIPYLLQPSCEEEFLRKLDLDGKIIYDVGAAHGVFSLFFANAVGENGRVVAFEPNPKLCKDLIENIKVNSFDNVMLRQIAVGKETKKEKLAFPSGELGIGSIETHERARIMSLKGMKTVEVQLDSIDHLISSGEFPKPDLVKIDVQGVELDVLIGMEKTIQEYRPKLFVELHSIPNINWKIQNVARVVDFLIDRGYSLHHVESKCMINSHNAHVINEDEHLYCV